MLLCGGNEPAAHLLARRKWVLTQGPTCVTGCCLMYMLQCPPLTMNRPQLQQCLPHAGGVSTRGGVPICPLLPALDTSGTACC